MPMMTEPFTLRFASMPMMIKPISAVSAGAIAVNPCSGSVSAPCISTN